MPISFFTYFHKLAKKITDGTEKHFKNGTSIAQYNRPAKEIKQTPEKLKATQVARDIQKITSSSKVYTVCKLDP